MTKEEETDEGNSRTHDNNVDNDHEEKGEVPPGRLLETMSSIFSSVANFSSNTMSNNSERRESGASIRRECDTSRRRSSTPSLFASMIDLGCTWDGDYLDEEKGNVEEERIRTGRRTTLLRSKTEAPKAYLVRGPVSRCLGPYVYQHRKQVGALLFLSFGIIAGLTVALVWLKRSNAELLGKIRAEDEDEVDLLLANASKLDGNSTQLYNKARVRHHFNTWKQTTRPTTSPTLKPTSYSTLWPTPTDTFSIMN